MTKKIFLFLIVSTMFVCFAPAAAQAQADAQANTPAAPQVNSPLSNQAENDFFPLRKGNFWIYKLSNKVQMRCEALGVEEKEGRQYVVTASFPSLDYQNVQKDYYSFEKDGVYYYGKEFKNLNAYYDPLLKEIPADITKPQKWEWEGYVSKIKTMITIETSPPEEFSFKGKVYAAYKVTQTIREVIQASANKKIILSKWYVQGIGRVKELNEIFVDKEHLVITAELEDYKLQ